MKNSIFKNSVLLLMFLILLSFVKVSIPQPTKESNSNEVTELTESSKDAFSNYRIERTVSGGVTFYVLLDGGGNPVSFIR